MKRKIAVVTGTRAEYGLLYWLLKEIEADQALELQLIVTGTHLSPAFGSTYQAIEKDGFPIAEKVDLHLTGGDGLSVTHSLAKGIAGMGEALARLRPDILVLLGDRFEILAAAQAAMLAQIPIAHIHGGESTEGLIDEAIRHAVTKMAHFHFVAADPYRKRVIQLGEDPAKVYNFGAPALDAIHRLKLLSKAELEADLNFKLKPENFLVTYHPVTLEGEVSKPLNELFSALEEFPGASVIFTKANADAGGQTINARIDEYVAKNSARMKAFASLGQIRYFSLMRESSAVIGNSSSGLIEAPYFHKPTVNIGDRQRGRLKASSVIDCQEKKSPIVEAIKKALSPAFSSGLAKIASPYGGENTSQKIMQVLKTADLSGVLKKRFHDLGAP